MWVRTWLRCAGRRRWRLRRGRGVEGEWARWLWLRWRPGWLRLGLRRWLGRWLRLWRWPSATFAQPCDAWVRLHSEPTHSPDGPRRRGRTWAATRTPSGRCGRPLSGRSATLTPAAGLACVRVAGFCCTAPRGAARRRWCAPRPTRAEPPSSRSAAQTCTRRSWATQRPKFAKCSASHVQPRPRSCSWTSWTPWWVGETWATGAMARGGIQ
mmetsp:Transcript_9229/g.29163  ORF Transcript_9229/g.29163 Transcript_9229/m.29163 type:complete len:211 (-) Transcript_9229:354-986(-)